jgi:hypothetical protein
VATRDGQPVYDDTKHLAAAGQRWIGGLLLADIRPAVTSPGTGSPSVATGVCETEAARVKPVAIASYTASATAPYLDSASHTKLTDGIRGRATFADPAWVGFHATTTRIVASLGSPAPVCTVTSDWLQVLGGAVTLPTSIDVYVSSVPGQLGQKLGTVEAPPLDPTDQTFGLTVTGVKPISGDVITLVINAIGDWNMTDEIAATALSPS